MAHDGVTRFARRLAARWDAACWTGIVVRAIPAAQWREGARLVRAPDHYMGAAWPPAAWAPPRWPEAVVIGSPAAENALAELFLHLPDEARVYLAGIDDVDAALAAEILLAADRNLEPYQRDALGAFVAAERGRARAAIAARYKDHDAGYARFRSRIVGPPRS
jgi:hypothetical protein